MRYRNLKNPSRIACLRGKRFFNAGCLLDPPLLCPFSGRQCKKNSGVCEMSFEKQDMIVCPARFEENNRIFMDVAEALGLERFSYAKQAELKISGCFFDYVLRFERELRSFYVFLEIQSLDISGSGWWELEKLKASLGVASKATQKHKPVGPNWQMSIKTLFAEILKKGKIAEEVSSPLFIVIQDGLWNYICKHYVANAQGDGLHWMIYSLDSCGRLFLSKTIKMGYRQFIELVHSESVAQKEEILLRLDNMFRVNGDLYDRS